MDYINSSPARAFWAYGHYKQQCVLTVCLTLALPVLGLLTVPSTAASSPPDVSWSARLAVCQDWATHWPDLAALNSLPTGWQIVHSVDSANGPGLDPPLILAAFTVAPYSLVHLWPCMFKHTQTGTHTKKTETHKWDYREKAVDCKKWPCIQISTDAQTNPQANTRARYM